MHKTSQQNRWLSLYLPRLATDRLLRFEQHKIRVSGRALALYAKFGNAFELTATDRRAELLGLYVGQSLADARAMAPNLIAREAEPEADQRLLEDIASWCERYTPIVICDGADGLLLDISGCAHLYGDEAELRAHLIARFNAQGFSACAAIAPNHAAAWGFARFSREHIIEEENLIAALSPLPLTALRLEEPSEKLLERLGLKTIAQLIKAPRAPFAARAGQAALLRLDQALGRAREALSPHRPPPALYAARRLAEPIMTLDAILMAVEHVCLDLVEKLNARSVGARHLLLSLFGVDGKTRRVELSLSKPSRDAKLIHRLWRERLNVNPENFDAEFGFEALRLDALTLAPIVLHATDLAPSNGRDLAAEARLHDALIARLGATNVARLAIRDVHAPEAATLWNAKGAVPPAPPSDGVMRRPLTLFKRAQPIEAMASVPDGPPLRFRWRRVLHEIIRAEGPERIAPNWLKAPDARTRDYYRVEDKNGRRFWLYREGLYDESAPPRWFVHGLFA